MSFPREMDLPQVGEQQYRCFVVFVLGGGTENEPEAEKDKDGLKFLRQPDPL